jgi:hypothetical protein
MKDLIIVGGGNSVQEGLDSNLWAKIKGKEIWSINYAFMSMPYLPSREIWVDISFFKHNTDTLQKLFVGGVPCHAKKHPIYAQIPEIKTYECTRQPNETNKLFIGRMGLSGFFALSLALREEYEKIYLLGYDFGTINVADKKTHFYQGILNVYSTGVNHPELYRNRENTVKNEVNDFENFVPHAEKIVNVSPNSNISYFKKANYEEFYAMLSM